ncbi:phosphoheptose isomerase [Pigmentiphaga soli]|uniref:Phosphoheptose isomerase n=1 Tax=Pigmentiphaga soli TaxID=1007095 RepID=A0ABP8HEC8_9BURK
MDLISRIAAHFRDAIALHEQCQDTLAGPAAAAVDALVFALSNDGKILACGNGGSAADAQHFVAELVGRFERERLPLAAVTLSADTSILTAVGNDFGYDRIFSQQVNALGRPGDVLVAISTSGNSANVIEAIDAAHSRDVRVIALTGKGGGRIGAMLTEDDIHLCVPHDRTLRIQEIHMLLLHALCDGIDAQLLGDL